MDRSEVAIIIPAYNEENTIAKVVASVAKYGIVIVVNDCSSDQTAEFAEQAGGIVVNHRQNQGYDGALNSGFAEASKRQCRYAITFDADGQHDPLLLETYLQLLSQQNFDLVLGVRPSKARFTEVIMGLYFQWRFGVHDILCGMKGYNMALYRDNKGFDHIKSIGTELALNSIKKKCSFIESKVPIHTREGKPRFGNIIKSNIRIAIALGKIICWDIFGLKVRYNQ